MQYQSNLLIEKIRQDRKSLNFSFYLENVDYSYIVVTFELFFRDMHNLDTLSNKDLDFVEQKTKEAAL